MARGTDDTAIEDRGNGGVSSLEVIAVENDGGALPTDSVSLESERVAPPAAPIDDAMAPSPVSRQRASRRTTRQSIREFVREPRQALQRLRPQVARVSVAGARQRASFRRKLLRSTTIHANTESHLKLGSFRSNEVAALVFFAKLIMSLGPVSQLIWTVFIEPDSPLPRPRRTFDVSISDGAEAAIQLLVVGSSCVFLRHTLRSKKRQPLQLVLAHLVACVAVVAAITFSADVLKSYSSNARQGRQLLSFANALLATSIYGTLSYLTDYFTEVILSSREAFQHERQERLLQRSRQLSFALNASCGLYLAVRLALTWRSDVVFDFIPGANLITPIRVELLEHKDVYERHVLLDALILSVFDAFLLALAIAKCSFTHRLFRHIFISDFARRYTEFRIFVINFRNTIGTITLSGHVAAWAVPFYHTIDAAYLDQPRLRLVSVGSVQLQLGFRLSLALWLLSVIYCALPVDAHLLPACLARTRPTHKVASVRIKYFISQAEALQKTAYRNLRHVGHADASEFILEAQIEAFNFAQLAYARGNARYDQELTALQALVGDPAFRIVEIVHDAATDTHCVLLASETKLVVTFRGTSSKANARTDLQSAMTLHLVAKQLDLTKVPSLRPHTNANAHATTKTKANATASAMATDTSSERTIWHRLLCKRNDPKVHSGFYAAYLSVADRVLDRVHSLYESEPRPILCTGHSLGGALAVLCAFDLVARQHISNVACTTFGCPRVGNHAFQKRFARVVPATFAFVNASDMVTKLPPKTPKAQSYASVGTTVLVNTFGNLIIEPNLLELDVMHRGYSPRAHTMRAYQLALLRWCLRTHHASAAFAPRFWRQSLAFLQNDYGHLPDVREYLKAALLWSPHMRMSLPALVGLPSTDQHATMATAVTVTATLTHAQLRGIARRLETALQQEQEDRDDAALTRSLATQLRQWFSWSEAREWFSTDDALRRLMLELQLESEAAALDLAQLLTVQGLLKPERVVFTRHARFYFSMVDDDDANEEAVAEVPTEGARGVGDIDSVTAVQDVRIDE